MNRLKNSYSGCMNCGGKVKMKSGGKKTSGAFTKQAPSNKNTYSSTTAKRANLSKTLTGLRKGVDGLLTEVDAVASNDQTALMEMAPRVKAVDPLLLAAKTDLNQFAQPALSPERQKVKSYQEMLRSKGYDIAADGAWGPKTQAAYDSYIKSKTTSANSASKVPAVSKSVVPAAQKLNPNFKITAATPYMRTSPAGKVGYTNTTRVGSFDPISRKTADLAAYARKVGTIRQTPGKKVYPTTRG